MENNELLDENLSNVHPNEDIYINPNVVDAYSKSYTQISHLSKLYFVLIIGSILATIAMGIWIMLQYADNSNMPLTAYFKEWKFILLLGITFVLGAAISLWFWKQFDLYQKAMGEYVQAPSISQFAIMQTRREKWWYLIQMVYMVWFAMYILQWFFPSSVPQVAEQINS